MLKKCEDNCATEKMKIANNCDAKNQKLISLIFTFCIHLFFEEFITCPQSALGIALQKVCEILDSIPNSVFRASIDKNKPIAVADNYITQKDTQLITDGSVGKEALFANDYTPDGQTYAYTCNVENKATTAGGTVQIQANGLFTYTPPANFTGNDTFTYTVNNVNGSGIGTVTIHVLPTIYVKLLTSDPKTYGHAGDEYWTKTRDYTLYFYSDAAGTQPLDVSGFGLKVKISETYNDINGGSNTTIWETNTVSGVNYKFYDDFVYFDRSDYGSLGYDVAISIAAGSYVII